MNKDFKVGDQVHYKTPFKVENGIVKAVVGDSLRVVYNCDNDWKNYQNYTSALTNIKDLFEGWV